MSKRLFIYSLPLSDNTMDFHELSILIDIDNQVKGVYQYKIKLGSSGYSLTTLESEGYTLAEVQDNPQDSFEVLVDIQRLFDMYINKSCETDLFLVYFYNAYDFDRFIYFLQDNGLRDVNKYLFMTPVDIKSLVLNKYDHLIDESNSVSVKDLSKSLNIDSLNEKSSLANLVLSYKLFKTLI